MLLITLSRFLELCLWHIILASEHCLVIWCGSSLQPLNPCEADHKTGLSQHSFVAMSYNSSFPVSTSAMQSGGPYSFDESPQSLWTAARCDTLTATLAGRLELLKSDGAAFLRRSTDEDTKDEPTLQSPDILKFKRTNRTTYAKKGRRARDAESGCQPPAERKSVAGQLVSPKRAQGETWGATPFLIRTKEGGNDNQGAAVQAEQLAGEESPHLVDKLRPPAFSSGPSQYKLKRQLKQVKTIMPANKYAMSMHVCESYQALLRATEEPSGTDLKPTISLFSMCLRAIPARIQLEQEMDDIEAKAADMKLITAARNHSSEMYSDIRDRNLGGHGGEHVKTILRAHGTAIMRDAVESGLLCHEFGTLSIMHCIRMRCKLEAEILVRAVLSKVTWGAPTSFQSRLPSAFSVLEDFRIYTGSTSAYFRVLKDMFSRERMPIQWLTTKDFHNLWPRLYTALAGGCHRQDAEELSSVVLPLLFKACFDAVHNVSTVTTFTSLLSTLCALVFVERTRGSSEQTSSGINNVLQAFIIDVSSGEKSHHNYIQPLLSILTNPASPEKVNFSACVLALASYHRATDSSHPFWHIIASLICSFLSRCERAELGMGLQQLQRLRDMVEWWTPLEMSEGQCLRNAMIRGILAFVRSLPDMPAIADAKDAAQTLHTHLGLEAEPLVCLSYIHDDGIIASPQPKLSAVDPDGCRWEEGIGEWVVITPGSDMLLDARVHGDGSHVAESPLASYRREVRARSAYTSKRKRSTIKDSSRSLLDLLPSSPTDTTGSDTEPENLFLSGITTYSNQAPSPRDDCEFRTPPKKFRKPLNGHRVTPTPQSGKRGYGTYGPSHADSAYPFTDVDRKNNVRLRTPFPPSPKSRVTKAAAIDRHYNMDSSGDELGY